MTVRVAGLWEWGWNVPMKEIEQWEYMLKDYGVVNLYMSPITGIQDPFVKESASVEPVLTQAITDNLTIVYLDEKATTTLDHTTTHPENVLYVFGRASHSPFTSYYDAGRGDLAWKIPFKREKPAGFWPHQACAIVLHERLKQWP